MSLLSSRRAKRATRKADERIRKAEEKAVKARAKIEAKAHADVDRKREQKRLKDQRKHHAKLQKQERKTAKVSGKSQKKAAQADAKVLAEQQKAAAKAGLTPAKVKRYLAVGKLVTPIAAPLVYRAAVAVREQVLTAQANRAGVPAATLAQYGGPSAALRARIDQARSAAAKVSGLDSTPEGQSFVTAMNGRLDNLAVAVDAADTMPPAQRRSAQRAISNELGAIDNDLLARLAVHP